MVKITLNGVLCTSIDDVRKSASPKVADFIVEFYGDSDYVVAHTSGSTGVPKEIHLLKSDMRASARITNEFFNLDSKSNLYLALSPDYIAGKMMIVRAIESGANLLYEEPSNCPLSQYDSNDRITFLAVVPSQLMFLINHPEILDKIETIIIGGGKLPERIEYWLADKGVKAYKTYGMTETCSHIALSPVSRNNLPYHSLADVSFATDDRGCLIINAAQFSNSKIVTNDVVELLNEHEFIYKGRFDNVINTGGLKVYPEDVENELSKILTKAKFYVSSQLSDKWGEELILVIEYTGVRAGDKKTGEINQNIIERLRKVLPPYAIPRKYVAVNKIEMTKSGKIIRKSQQ